MCGLELPTQPAHSGLEISMPSVEWNPGYVEPMYSEKFGKNFEPFIGAGGQQLLPSTLDDVTGRYELLETESLFGICGQPTEISPFCDMWNEELYFTEQEIPDEIIPMTTIPSSTSSIEEVITSLDQSPEFHCEMEVSNDEASTTSASKPTSDPQWCCDFTNCGKTFTHRYKLKYEPLIPSNVA